MWDTSTVTLTTDNKSRLCSATLFKPHTSYRAEKTVTGAVVLTELAPVSVPNPGRLVRKGGRLVIEAAHPDTVADIRAALADFP